jgi:hypothetical protein
MRRCCNHSAIHDAAEHGEMTHLSGSRWNRYAPLPHQEQKVEVVPSSASRAPSSTGTID